MTPDRQHPTTCVLWLLALASAAGYLALLALAALLLFVQVK